MRRLLLCSVSFLSLTVLPSLLRAQDAPNSSAPAELPPKAAQPAQKAAPAGEAPNKAGASKATETEPKTGMANPNASDEETPNKAGARKATQAEPEAGKANPKTSDEEAPNKAGARKATQAEPEAGKANPKPSAEETRNKAEAPKASTAKPEPATAGKAQTTTDKNNSAAEAAPSRLQPEQRSKVVETLSSHTEARTNVNFSASVGIVVPETVHLYPLPPDIVSIVPEYRGYDYVIVRDEIVIIQPRTRKVVTVISRSGGTASARGGRLHIEGERRSSLHSRIIHEYRGPKISDVSLEIGARVPSTVVLERVPEVIYSDDSDLRDYEYFVEGEHVYLVDPDSREVIDILD